MCHDLEDNTFTFPTSIFACFGYDRYDGYSIFCSSRSFPTYGGWAGLLKMAHGVAGKWGIEFDTKDKLGRLEIFFGCEGLGLAEADRNTLRYIARLITDTSLGTCQFCGSNFGVRGVSSANKGSGWRYSLCLECAPLIKCPYPSSREEQLILVEAALKRLRSELKRHDIQIRGYNPDPD